jgi:hypothetical protein
MCQRPRQFYTISDRRESETALCSAPPGRRLSGTESRQPLCRSCSSPLRPLASHVGFLMIPFSELPPLAGHPRNLEGTALRLWSSSLTLWYTTGLGGKC